MAATTYYALVKISTPNHGIIPVGDEVPDLSDDAAKTLLAEGSVTTDKSEGDSAAASAIVVPPSGTTDGSVPVIEQEISG